MKSILKNSNGNAVSTSGKLFTVSANYTDQIKQALIDKGVASEDTPSSELANVVRGISTLKKLLDTTKKADYLFYKYNGVNVDGLIGHSDTENVTSARYIYSESKIENIPNIDLRKVWDFQGGFNKCVNLTTIYVKTETFYSLSTASYMFGNCSSLTEVFFEKDILPSTCQNMFYNCKKLELVYNLNLINVTDSNWMSGIFESCNALKDLIIFNIKANIYLGYATLLSLNSITNTIKELVNTGSTKTLTMGSANLEKIANVYVRRTTEGDIPTCLSDNSNIDLAKAPCEVCNADDEGAMSIIAYANSKNWTLA